MQGRTQMNHRFLVSRNLVAALLTMVLLGTTPVMAQAPDAIPANAYTPPRTPRRSAGSPGILDELHLYAARAAR